MEPLPECRGLYAKGRLWLSLWTVHLVTPLLSSPLLSSPPLSSPLLSFTPCHASPLLCTLSRVPFPLHPAPFSKPCHPSLVLLASPLLLSLSGVCLVCWSVLYRLLLLSALSCLLFAVYLLLSTFCCLPVAVCAFVLPLPCGLFLSPLCLPQGTTL